MLILLVVTINCIIRSIAIMYFYPNNRNSFLVSWAIFLNRMLFVNKLYDASASFKNTHSQKDFARIYRIGCYLRRVNICFPCTPCCSNFSKRGWLAISLTAFTERNSLIMRHFSGIHLSSSARLFPVFDARKRHAWYVSKYKAQASGRTEISLDCHRVYVYTRMSVFVHL